MRAVSGEDRLSKQRLVSIPDQPAERRYEITCAILEEMAQHHGLSLGIVTKSTLIVTAAEERNLLGD